MPRSRAAQPPLDLVLEAVRVSRERGDLGTAKRALGHLQERIGELPSLTERVALEAELLAKELVARGAYLGALESWLTAHALGRDQRRNFDRLTERFSRWRPEPASIGVPKDALLASATGVFQAGSGKRARIISLAGGITGNGTEAFRRVLSLAHVGVDWLLIDVEGLTYVGSSGLAIIVKSAEQLREARGGVALFSPSSNLKLLVETLGLGDSLHPVADLNAALQLIHRA